MPNHILDLFHLILNSYKHFENQINKPIVRIIKLFGEGNMKGRKKKNLKELNDQQSSNLKKRKKRYRRRDRVSPEEQELNEMIDLLKRQVEIRNNWIFSYRERNISKSKMKIEIRKKWLSDKKSEYNDHLEDNRGKKNQEVSFRGRMIYKAMMQAEEMLSESIYDYNSLLSHYKNLDDILDEEQGISTRKIGRAHV